MCTSWQPSLFDREVDGLGADAEAVSDVPYALAASQHPGRLYLVDPRLGCHASDHRHDISRLSSIGMRCMLGAT